MGYDLPDDVVEAPDRAGKGGRPRGSGRRSSQAAEYRITAPSSKGDLALNEPKPQPSRGPSAFISPKPGDSQADPEQKAEDVLDDEISAVLDRPPEPPVLKKPSGKKPGPPNA